MKANSMSICVPSIKGEDFFCNKNCPYCVTKMTGMNPVNRERFLKNFNKAKHIGELAQVTSIIITGKSEPLLDLKTVKHICEIFSEFPIEIQTNGLLLNEETITLLGMFGIDTIAISIDSYAQMEKLASIIPFIKEKGMTLRYTINLTGNILQKNPNSISYIEYTKEILSIVKNYGVDQVSFRDITIPNYAIDTEESRKTQEWINLNIPKKWAGTFIASYEWLLQHEGVKVCELPFGAVVYMYDGMSCTYFGYCIQDSNKDNDIRSLIYYEDGHMATTWYGSNYGRVF